MNRLCVSIPALLFLLLMVATNSNALSAINVSEEQLIRKAEMIVIGTVLSAYSEKDASSGEVFTYITVRVQDQLKGKARVKDIVMKTIGGRTRDEIVSIPGAADFYRGEEVLLFLERRVDGSLMPIGMVLGKYSIYRDSETGKRIAFRHTDGNGQYFATQRPDTALVEPEKKLYLYEFRTRIQKIVGSGR